jgi:hypothetical protein
MKLLINLCGHDGIISHYAGVGTIVQRYIEVINYLLNNKNIDYHLNLFTLEFNNNSMGYNKKLYNKHKKLKNTSIYICKNGTNGETSFGNIDNWKLASLNVSKIINKINFSNYDFVITIANDTPFAGLLKIIKDEKNSIKVWVPHSTAKIYTEDLSLSSECQNQKKRIKWEQETIDYINKNKNTYLISTGKYIKNHLINKYNLLKSKNIDLINGEILYRDNFYETTQDMKKLLEKLEKYESIILSFGRAEKYKNLEKTMILGDKMKIKPIVITQQYYKNQPLVKEYKILAKQLDSLLCVDFHFNLPQYIIKYYTKKIIMLIPSEKEIFGLIINEIRRFNKDNVLIVANKRGGLVEQITDSIDGILVDLNNIEESAKKISKFFNKIDMEKININAQRRLKKDYNLTINFDKFLKKVLRGKYE